MGPFTDPVFMQNARRFLRPRAGCKINAWGVLAFMRSAEEVSAGRSNRLSILRLNSGAQPSGPAAEGGNVFCAAKRVGFTEEAFDPRSVDQFGIADHHGRRDGGGEA